MEDADRPSRPKSRPTSEAKLGFTRQPMVSWLAPRFLVKAAREVQQSDLFARFADKREVEAGIPTSLYEPRELERTDRVLPPYKDASYRDDGDLWIDFASDVGEGFDATYTVAWLLARPRLTLVKEKRNEEGEATARIEHDTRRGAILILGGDEVYPSAKWDHYRDRFVGPYTAALPWVEDRRRAPHMFAIPGNHDWYDGLTSFTRVFCQGSWIGGWRTRQRRSYFALRLNERWWLWATDIQFDTYLDGPQLDYFRTQAKALKEGHRVILVTAKPSWVDAGEQDDTLMASGSWETLRYVEEHLIASRGAEVAVTLTGDKHHYSRYTSVGGVFPNHRITAGGGGAHTSATHGLPRLLRLPRLGSDGEATATYRRRRRSPTARESKRMRNRIPIRVLGVGTMGILIAAIYTGIAVLMTLALGERIGVWTTIEGSSLLDLLGGAVSVSSIAAVVALAVGLFAFAWLKQPAGAIRAGVLALLHTAAHVLAISLLMFAGYPLLLIPLLSYLAGSVVFGLYLLFANMANARQHATEIFGALASTDYKNFLRLCLKSDGSLRIYPVGIRHSASWKLRTEGDSKSPWFAAKDYDPEEPKAFLIEGPINVSPPPLPPTRSKELAG